MSKLARLATTGGATPIYVEDVFSTYLYTGNGSTQTITNGIDLAGQGGLVWLKDRTSGAHSHWLTDTARGVNFVLRTNATDAQASVSGTYLTSFNSNGFGIGGAAQINTLNNNLVSWTFRKQAKFFDVVTYTGNSNLTQTIPHNLGVTPGFIIVKSTGSGAWGVWHRSLGTQNLELNSTGTTLGGYGGLITSVTSSSFQVGRNDENATYNYNLGSTTYVAYLFAHDAGGFGASGSDNVISCGSFTSTGGVQDITLGWEPQWLMLKKSNDTSYWTIKDTFRGSLTATVTGISAANLNANLANAEETNSNVNGVRATATGFQLNGNEFFSGNVIYIAIRRGPMKTPTTGTSVYNAIARSGTGSTTTVSGVSFVPDYLLTATRNVGDGNKHWDRLRGAGKYLRGHATDAEVTTAAMTSFNQDGYSIGNDPSGTLNESGWTYINHFFRRAPGFFDVVCYTGTGVANNAISHNLGVVPELLIIKRRQNGQVGGWVIYNAFNGPNNRLYLDTSAGVVVTSNVTNAVSANSFTVGSDSEVNASANTYVAYLFASLPGISKVGSYTGNGGTVNTNGTAQTINCGFAAGARFVLIKRTDSTGDWYTFDTARGLVSGNDPYVLLNSSAAEVTTVDAVDPDNSGFVVNQTSGTNLNVTSATYIYLAIA